MSKTQDMAKTMPAVHNKGIKNLVGSPVIDVSCQVLKKTLTGADVEIVFAEEGLVDMADDDYVVQLQGETVTKLNVDESTILPTGFHILGGLNNEVAHIAIFGRTKGQLKRDGTV